MGETESALFQMAAIVLACRGTETRRGGRPCRHRLRPGAAARGFSPPSGRGDARSCRHDLLARQGLDPAIVFGASARDRPEAGRVTTLADLRARTISGCAEAEIARLPRPFGRPSCRWRCRSAARRMRAARTRKSWSGRRACRTLRRSCASASRRFRGRLGASCDRLRPRRGGSRRASIEIAQRARGRGRASAPASSRCRAAACRPHRRPAGRSAGRGRN